MFNYAVLFNLPPKVLAVCSFRGAEWIFEEALIYFVGKRALPLKR